MVTGHLSVTPRFPRAAPLALLAAALLLAGCVAGPQATGGAVLGGVIDHSTANPGSPDVTPGQPLPSTPLPGAPTPVPDTRPPLNPNLPRGIESSGAAPPVVSLVRAAKGQIKSNQLDQAGASLDRALRIEPRNGWVWLAQSQLHLAQKQPEQAESEAKKAISLGKRNPYLEVESWRVIAAARAQRGDNAGAADARGRVDDLQLVLGNANP